MSFPIQLDAAADVLSPADHSPLFVKIAARLSQEIRRGRLQPGDRLPGTRSLAEQLGVGRNTVVAAYAELAAEGWIETRPAGGSFVSREVPESRLQRFGNRAGSNPRAVAPGYSFERQALAPAQPVHPDCLTLFGGTPDLSRFPAPNWRGRTGARCRMPTRGARC